MLTSFKFALQAWAKGLVVLALSPFYVQALALIAALWSYAAYEWLWLPESSWSVLILALAWIIALVAIAVIVVAGTAQTVLAVADDTDKRLRLKSILRLRRSGRIAVVLLVGSIGVFALTLLFAWLNGSSRWIGSFLTFHFQHPVSYIAIGKVFWYIEALIWIALAAVLIRRVLVVSGLHPQAVSQSANPSAGRYPRLMAFLTGVLTVAIFGGIAWRLSRWHPIVKPGSWDYAQLIIRNGLALLLLTYGWLFWWLTSAFTISLVQRQAASAPQS